MPLLLDNPSNSCIRLEHTPHWDWVTLEHLISPQCLRSSPWMHPKHISSDAKLHPLIGPTLDVFHISIKVSNPTPYLSPLTPLRSNTDFPPGTNDNFLSQIWPHRDVLATHLFHRGAFLSLDDLNAKLAPNRIPMWTYMQIRHYLSRPETAHHWMKHSSTLEVLCTKKQKEIKDTLSLDCILNYSKTTQLSPVMHV